MLLHDNIGVTILGRYNLINMPCPSSPLGKFANGESGQEFGQLTLDRVGNQHQLNFRQD